MAETQLTKSRFSSPETIIERLQMYKLAFNLWWDNPFWGSGLGVFYDVSEVVLGKNFVIHSTPLWILTEFGIVGFFIFSMLLLRLCLWLHRSNPNSIGNRCLKLALVVFVVGSLFHDFFYQRVFG